MNERIRELIKQADIEFDVSSDHYGIDTAVVIPYDLDKFAELIVRSCSNIAAHHNSLDAAEDIMKHFGVQP